MKTCVRITDGPLGPPASAIDPDARTGARVVFEGVVRGEEDSRPIRALLYEFYEPMASRLLAALAREIAETRGLLGVHVEHSRGEVPAGACSFRLVVHAAHRHEALTAMEEFITRMKRGSRSISSPFRALL